LHNKGLHNLRVYM